MSPHKGYHEYHNRTIFGARVTSCACIVFLQIDEVESRSALVSWTEPEGEDNCQTQWRYQLEMAHGHDSKFLFVYKSVWYPSEKTISISSHILPYVVVPVCSITWRTCRQAKSTVSGGAWLLYICL